MGGGGAGDAAVNPRKNKMARALLLEALPGDVLLQVATKLTAREVWDSLKVRFVAPIGSVRRGWGRCAANSIG